MSRASAAVRSFFNVLFDPKRTVKKGEILGPVPGIRQFYGNQLRLILPATIEAVLMGIANILDNLMVSVLGTVALTAVGLTSQPVNLVNSLIVSFTVGITAMISRRRGEDDIRGANRVLRVSLLIMLLLTLFSSFFGFLVSKPLLVFMEAGEDTLDYGLQYFRTYLLSVPFLGIKAAVNAAQRASGNSRVSMYSNLSGGFIKVFLNWTLIEGHFGFPRLEVKGAAISTVISVAVSAAISVCSLIPKKSFLSFFQKASFFPTKNIMNGLLKVASSGLLEQLCMRVGIMLYFKFISKLGTETYATYTIMQQLLNFNYLFFDGIGNSAAALAGQSLGAGRPDLTKMNTRSAGKIGNLLLCVLVPVTGFFGRQIFSLFTSEPGILVHSVPLSLSVVAVILVNNKTNLYVNSLRGCGDSKFTALMSFVSMAGIRTFVTYLGCVHFGWGLYGAVAALLLDQIVRCMAYRIRFDSGRWMRIKL